MDLLRMQEGGAKFKNRVSNTRMFRLYMLVKQPVLGVTGATLEVVETERIEMRLPDSRATRNLFGDFFGGAVAVAAETTSAAMCVLHIRNQDASVRAELAELTMRQERRAEGDLRIIAERGVDYAEFVERAREEGEAEESFPLLAIDGSGQTTHSFTITWRLFPK